MAVDASTLPYEWYVDPGTFELERQRIFSSTWQYVGHVGRVGSTGDFFTAQLGELPIVITRDEDGQLHALRNVCCHRSAEVVLAPEGTARPFSAITTPGATGWTAALSALRDPGRSRASAKRTSRSVRCGSRRTGRSSS